MPIFFGQSADGSDMQEFKGMHVSSCGNYWSNIPFTKESEREMRKLANKRKWRILINKPKNI